LIKIRMYSMIVGNMRAKEISKDKDTEKENALG
jgi:hypothetical protein